MATYLGGALSKRVKLGWEQSKLLISASTEHNHDTDARKVERQQIRVSVKRKANNDIAERPSKLIRSELQTGEEQHLTDNDMKSLSLAIYRQSRKRHPTLPKCIIDVHEALSTMTVNTSRSEDMCLVNDVDSHIIIFFCTSNLRVLCTQVKEIFIDGTFKCCP